MKLQKASRYALYAVLHLASAPDRQHSTAEIAQDYGISIHHLAKVMRTLVRSGLIESIRDVLAFSMAVSHWKWEPFENRVFRMAMLIKPWMAFSTNC